MAVEEESGEFRASDGRLVTFSLYGPVDGPKVVGHNGTPGTRHLGPRMTRTLERHGVRMLVLDRPGYGASSRWPGRRVADVVTDIREIVDRQGWDHFAVWGGSGGGPHALACAGLLAGRVTRCASVVGPAPYGVPGLVGLDWFEGMSPGNVEEFSRALEGEESYRPLVERLAQEAVDAAQEGQVPVSLASELPEADIAALRTRMNDEGYVERILAANRDGVDGWIDDCIAMSRPWGVDLSAIDVPVSVWYGRDDVLCPRNHAEWLLSNIPNAERHELPDGHLLDDNALDALYGWLLALS
ncbi:MAG TPA: alpha/beta hydrolase [Streptosporangiaceae bacterium]|nr:alpha/beta hydrolase [Streptosporangiaceae bacterium]